MFENMKNQHKYWIERIRNSNIEDKELILEFDNRLELKENLSYKTRVSYCSFIVEFAKFLNKRFSEVTEDDFLYYKKYLKSKGNTQNTINLKGLKLKKFLRFVDNNCIESYKFELKNREITESDLPTIQEIKNMILYYQDPRNRAIISHFIATGCRNSEIAYANIGDIAFHKNHAIFSVRVSKTKKRDIAMAFGWTEIRDYLKYHKNKKDPTAPLYYSINGKRCGERLGTQGIRKIIKSTGGYTPHTLRHWYETYVLSSQPESVGNELMGWTKDTRMRKTYNHLNSKSASMSLLKSMGVEIEEKTYSEQLKELMPKECWNCGYYNSFYKNRCEHCGENLNKIISKEDRKLDNAWAKLIQDSDFQDQLQKLVSQHLEKNSELLQE